MKLPPPATYASRPANDVCLSDVQPNVLPPSPSGNTSRPELPIKVIVETPRLQEGRHRLATYEPWSGRLRSSHMAACASAERVVVSRTGQMSRPARPSAPDPPIYPEP